MGSKVKVASLEHTAHLRMNEDGSCQGISYNEEHRMKVTIEEIEVDHILKLREGLTYWVTAIAEDDSGPFFLDVFNCDPNIWDIMRGVGEVASAEVDAPDLEAGD